MQKQVWRGWVIIGLVVLLQAILTREFSPMPAANSRSAPVYAAGVTVATDDAETVFTASEDGKTVYMWQYYSSKPPKYLGKSEAVLNE